MKKSKNDNIILGFGYWVFEFGFSWCKGKVIWFNWFFVTPYFIQNKIQTYFKTENMYYLPSFDRVTVFYLVYYIRKCTFRWLEKRSLITMDKKGSLKQFSVDTTVSWNGTGFDSELFLQNTVDVNDLVKFICSEKSTKFCKISNLLLSCVVSV